MHVSALHLPLPVARSASALLATLLLYLAQSACAASPQADENWPQFRGPLETGAAPSANPPIEWSADENIKWKAKIPGSGASTPIIWGDRIFILTAIPTGKKIETPAASIEQPAGAPATAPAEAPAGGNPPPASGAAPPAGSSHVSRPSPFQLVSSPPAADVLAMADDVAQTPAAPVPSATPPAADAKATPAPTAAPSPPDAKAAPNPTAAPPADGKAPPSGDSGGSKGDGKGPRGAAGGRPGGGRGRGFGPPPKPTEYHQFVVLCLNRTNGETIWQQVAAELVPHEGHHQDHGFASYTPATDGTCLIAYFGSRGIYCYDMDGNLKWKKDLGQMRTRFSFGEGSSPALFGNTIVVTWDHEGDDFVVALDKETGNELWRTPREEETGWATPLIVDYQGKPQVIATSSKVVRAYDLATGKQIWECSGMTPASIPTPVAADGIVYVMTGFRGSALVAVRLGGEGDLTGTESIVWKRDSDTPYVPSPLLYGGKLYFYKSNNAVLTCLNAEDGKVLYGPQRLEGVENVYASPLGAGGQVYLAGRNGTVLVIAGGDKYEVLATNKIDDRFDASPVAVGNELFLRGKEYLYCIADNSTVRVDP